MIDVWDLFGNALWIAGLAVLLATLSWAHWVASEQQGRMRAVLARPWPRRMLSLGCSLLCMGLAATGRAWWEVALWGLLSAAWAVCALRGR